jgi:hypothetical protein
MEIRAYHLDRAVCLREELEGAATRGAPAARRDRSRGSRKAARAEPRGVPDRHSSQLLRALELEPTLRRRYLAALAAWRLQDLQTVAVEMEAGCRRGRSGR